MQLNISLSGRAPEPVGRPLEATLLYTLPSGQNSGVWRMSPGAGDPDKVRELRRRCQELDRLIADQTREPVTDFSEIRRLREEKRALTAQITALEQGPPDIIA